MPCDKAEGFFQNIFCHAICCGVEMLEAASHGNEFRTLPQRGEFADHFVSPVVLVGPEKPDQFRLNSRAAMIADKLGLSNGSWEQIVHASA